MTETSAPDASARLLFQKQLLAVTNKIHATNHVNQLVLDVSADICALFGADRFLLYLAAEDEQTLVFKTRTRADSFKDLTVPISDQSVAGFAALTKRTINVRNARDKSQLRAISPNLHLAPHEEESGERDTMQVLATPILDWRSHGPLGVIELVNSQSGEPFGNQVEEGFVELAQTLAVALRQRRKQQLPKTKYDLLVADAVLSSVEFEAAISRASVRQLDIEQVLMDEFQLQRSAIGSALSKYFGVLYEPYSDGRTRPKKLLSNLSREYVETNQWLPISGTKSEVIVLCLDPERVRASGVVPNVFPKVSIVYRVTTVGEFHATVEQFYGAKPADEVSFSDRDADDFARLITRIVANAYRAGDAERLVRETANLWAHCLIMLERHGLGLSDVLDELGRRKGTSRDDEESA